MRHITSLLLGTLHISNTFVGSAQETHPLDPLSKDEIAAAAQILKDGGKATEASRFATIVLHEPPKAEVLKFEPGAPFRREAFVVVYEGDANKTFEAVVDLKNRAVILPSQAGSCLNANRQSDGFHIAGDRAAQIPTAFLAAPAK